MIVIEYMYVLKEEMYSRHIVQTAFTGLDKCTQIMKKTCWVWGVFVASTQWHPEIWSLEERQEQEIWMWKLPTMPTINILPLNFKFIPLFLFLCDTQDGRCGHFSFPAAAVLGSTHRGCWRDTKRQSRKKSHSFPLCRCWFSMS